MKIITVVVTYNRLELLRCCVESINNQTVKCDDIIVVDNSSSDGTFEWLSNQRHLTVITQPNLGGAGGFNTGMKAAFEKGFDWVWLLDSDVVPAEDALEQLINSSSFKNGRIGFLSSIITVPSDELSYINLPYLSDGYEIVNSIFNNQDIPIVTSSFGSVVISRDAVEAVGFPAKNFFIWGDDVEYTLRMMEKGFLGRLVVESKAVHHQINNFKNPFAHINVFDWKSKYSIRNMTFCTKQKNKVLNNSSLRGNLAALYFIVTLVKSRERISINELVRIIFYWLQGLFFKPNRND